MRVATFNVESLDAPLGARAQILVPALERLDADIVCLQEVHAQRVPGRPQRELTALDELLAKTRYRGYFRAVTTAESGHGPADVHNLVTLSRFPVVGQRQVHHHLLEPASVRLATADPAAPAGAAVRFDRPVLVTQHEVSGRIVRIVNVHLRAPLATAIAGQKHAPFVWKSARGWAEGYYLSGIKRMGQALEVRLLADEIFDREPDALLLIAGDLNAEDHESPVRILAGAPEDTGNAELAARALVVLDRAIDPDRRFSVVHHGRPQMLDHMLASHALYGLFRGIEVHNEALGDEAIGYAKGLAAAGSYHAAVVASFVL